MKYELLPFNFEYLEAEDVFISNLSGDFLFLNKNDFNDLVSGNVDIKNNTYLDLESKNIITTGKHSAELLTASRLLSKKANTFAGPRLHIVAVTRACNCRCDYCHVSSYPSVNDIQTMDLNVAEATAKAIMSSPSRDITIEFQGGEPTLAMEIVRFIIEYIRILNIKAKKNVTFVLCTNLLDISHDLVRYIKKRNIEISSSLDGPPVYHDCHRHSLSGSTHDRFLKNLQWIEHETEKKVSSLLTVTRNNLGHLREIIDYYIDLKREYIFIRQLNPFGRAHNNSNLKYSSEEFTDAYIDALEYIFEKNLEGIMLREFTAALFLRRIFTPFDDGFVDLRFPGGAGNCVFVYDYNGNVYPSDEARMMAYEGDTRLKMGNVLMNDFEEMRNSNIAKNILMSSIPFSIPGCAYCPYMMYCGIDPIKIFADTGEFAPLSESAECRKNRTILRWLFKKIRNASNGLLRVLYSWIA